MESEWRAVLGIRDWDRLLGARASLRNVTFAQVAGAGAPVREDEHVSVGKIGREMNVVLTILGALVPYLSTIAVLGSYLILIDLAQNSRQFSGTPTFESTKTSIQVRAAAELSVPRDGFPGANAGIRAIGAAVPPVLAAPAEGTVNLVPNAPTITVVQ